jgi:hypothetical protein
MLNLTGPSAAVITIDTKSLSFNLALARFNNFQAKMPSAQLVRWSGSNLAGVHTYMVASESNIFEDHRVYVNPDGTYSCFCKWGTQLGTPKGYCLHLAGVWQHIENDRLLTNWYDNGGNDAEETRMENISEAAQAGKVCCWQCGGDYALPNKDICQTCLTANNEASTVQPNTLAAGQPENVVVIDAGPGSYGTRIYWVESEGHSLGSVSASSWNSNQGANWSAYSYDSQCVVTGASDRNGKGFRDRTTQTQAINDVLVANGLPAIGETAQPVCHHSDFQAGCNCCTSAVQALWDEAAKVAQADLFGN